MKAALIRAVGDAATEYLSYVQGVEPGVPGDLDSEDIDMHGNRLRTPVESADLWSDFFEHALQRLNGKQSDPAIRCKCGMELPYLREGDGLLKYECECGRKMNGRRVNDVQLWVDNEPGVYRHGEPTGPIPSCCAWCGEAFGPQEIVQSETQGNYHSGCYDLMIKNYTKICAHCGTTHERDGNCCCEACALVFDAPEEG